MLTLAKDSDNLVRLDKLRNASTDAYVNTATVTFTLREKDDALTAVSGATNISMAYVAGSNGRYEGILQDSVVMVADREYWLDVTAIDGASKLFRRCESVCRTRAIE